MAYMWPGAHMDDVPYAVPAESEKARAVGAWERAANYARVALSGEQCTFFAVRLCTAGTRASASASAGVF